MRAVVLDHWSPGQLTNLKFSEKANHHNLKLGVYLLLKISEFAEDLIIPTSALYSYIRGWVWTGLGEEAERSCVGGKPGHFRWLCHLLGDKSVPLDRRAAETLPVRVGVGSEEKGLQGH